MVCLVVRCSQHACQFFNDSQEAHEHTDRLSRLLAVSQPRWTRYQGPLRLRKEAALYPSPDMAASTLTPGHFLVRLGSWNLGRGGNRFQLTLAAQTTENGGRNHFSCRAGKCELPPSTRCLSLLSCFPDMSGSREIQAAVVIVGAPTSMGKVRFPFFSLNESASSFDLLSIFSKIFIAYLQRP